MLKGGLTGGGRCKGFLTAEGPAGCCGCDEAGTNDVAAGPVESCIGVPPRSIFEIASTFERR
jgi:hypothetical protein